MIKVNITLKKKAGMWKKHIFGKLFFANYSSIFDYFSVPDSQETVAAISQDPS